MSKWTKAKLGEVSLGIYDGPHATPAPCETPGPYFLGIPQISRLGFIDMASPRYIAERDYGAWTKRVVPQYGDVVFSYEATLNLYALIPRDFKCCLGRRMGLVRPNPKKLDFQFLYYYFFSPEWRGTVRENTITGATVDRLSIAAFPNFEIALPPLPIQRRIAAILSDYDSAIDNARRQIALLEEAAMRLYREWFGDGRQEKVLLVDVASVTYGFPFVGKLFNDKGLGLPIIRIRNVPEGLSKDFTTEKAPDRYIVKDGDILIGMDGEFYVNFWSGGDAYLVQRTCRLRPNDAHMFGFVLEAIKGPIRAFQSAIVGSTVGHLGKKDIDTISIPIPKDKKIVDLLQDGFEQRLTLMKQIHSLTEARDRLLPKLMSGEIEV